MRYEEKRIEDDARLFNELVRKELSAMVAEMSGIPGDYPEIRPTAWLAQCCRMHGCKRFLEVAKTSVETEVKNFMKGLEDGGSE